MRRLVDLLPLLVACACAAAPRVARLPPRGDAGEVFVYAAPLPRDAAHVTVRIHGLALERDDGAEVPLELVEPTVGAREQRDQSLLAWGRVPSARYRGLRVRIGSAALTTDTGAMELLAPAEPVAIPISIELERRSARVVSLALRPEAPIQERRFEPRFTAVVPPRTPPQRVALCSNAGGDSVTVVERGTNLVTGVVTTGREPSGLAIDALGSRAYVALAGDDQIDVLDLTVAESRRRVRLQLGDEPREVALTPDRSVLLSMNALSRTVSFVDPGSLVELGRARVGESPSALLLDRSGRRAYVLNRKSSSISVVDVASRSVVRTVLTAPEPLRAALNRDGTRLFVIFAGSNELAIFSVPDFALVGHIFVGLGATEVQFDPRTNLLYVAKSGERRIAVYDPFSLLPVDDVPTPGTVTWMAFDETENVLLLLVPERRSITVVDLTSRRTRALVDVGLEPYAIAVGGAR